MDIQLGRTFVILGEDRDEVRRPLEFSVIADYNFGSTKYSETTQFDLNIHRVRALTTDAMVEQMSYLQDRLKDIRNELRGIGVAIAERSDTAEVRNE